MKECYFQQSFRLKSFMDFEAPKRLMKYPFEFTENVIMKMMIYNHGLSKYKNFKDVLQPKRVQFRNIYYI